MVKLRAVGFWALGTICLFLAMFVISGVQSGQPSAITAYIITFILTLVGGIFWISVGAIDEEKKV